MLRYGYLIRNGQPDCDGKGIGDELNYVFTCKSTDINLLRCKYIQPYFYNNLNVYKMKGMLSMIITHFPVSIGIFILQIHSLHNQVKLTCDSFNKYGSNLNSFLELPILTYFCEVWGFENCAEIEKVHLRFCKNILKVRQTTCKIDLR
jgi:hypothetical protein